MLTSGPLVIIFHSSFLIPQRRLHLRLDGQYAELRNVSYRKKGHKRPASPSGHERTIWPAGI
jgi:hypothetical protein